MILLNLILFQSINTFLAGNMTGILLKPPNHHNSAPLLREDIREDDTCASKTTHLSNHCKILCKDAQAVDRCLCPGLDVLAEDVFVPKACYHSLPTTPQGSVGTQGYVTALHILHQKTKVR